MKFNSWKGDEEIELKDCPFCGGEPEVKHIGNAYTKKRRVEVKCKKCRATKVNGAIRFDFAWLERVSADDWNQRVSADDWNQRVSPQ